MSTQSEQPKKRNGVTGLAIPAGLLLASASVFWSIILLLVFFLVQVAVFSE
jgi:hypothetical protein